jgi:hypothetical protein
VLEKGLYRHYKGKYYEVIGVAKHSETGESLVVYRPLYGEQGLWVRPLKCLLKPSQWDETFYLLGEKQMSRGQNSPDLGSLLG